jgi:hypothetical protein
MAVVGAVALSTPTPARAEQPDVTRYRRGTRRRSRHTDFSGGHLQPPDLLLPFLEAFRYRKLGSGVILEGTVAVAVAETYMFLAVLSCVSEF